MGQVCTATSRLYVQDTIYDKFLEAFKKQTKENTNIGSQFDANVNHGPQVSKAAQERILSYVESAKSEGAELIHGGTQSGIPEKGYFIEPTVFANCTNDMKIVREEIFGPFVVIQSFKTEDEVVTKANDSDFGLGAAVFTKDIMRGHRVAGAIEAGMVWINSSQDSHFGVPFGGYKQSGIGRELGQYALSSYTQVKAVHVNLGTFL
jgi:aldehyde dehydrogenase (NAD+)